MADKSGYVYILTNPCIQYSFKEGNKKKVISPVKIGKAKNLEKRIGTLNTSLPENFEHHMSVEANDAKAVENVVQEYLKEYRIYTKTGEKTEFFRCSAEDAVAALKRAARHMHLKEYKFKKDKLIGRSASKIKSNALKPKNRDNIANAVYWENKTQLAKLIARKGGNEGSFGYILHIFNKKCSCSKNSKWRPVLKQAGLKFDSNDFLINWSKAKKHL